MPVEKRSVTSLANKLVKAADVMQFLEVNAEHHGIFVAEKVQK